MKPLLLYLGALGVVVTIVVTATALWYARAVLPLVGTLLVAVVSIGLVGFTVWLLCFGYLHLRGIYLGQRLLVADTERIAIHDQGQVVVVPTIHAPHTLTIPARATNVQPIEEDRIVLPVAPRYSTIAHMVSPGRLILGYGTNGAITGDVTDLLSTAIVGRPGTGKSTMLRFVCAQIMRINGLPLIWDPHGSIVDDLGDLLQCSESTSEIAASARRIDLELDRRLAARRSGTLDHAPLLLMADEWPVISAMCDQATDTIRRVVLEGRKVNIFALICGQGLPASLLGGSLVRDALASRYVFNTTPAQARLAGIENDVAKTLLAQIENSGPGYAILATSRRPAQVVAIPETVTSDIVVSGNTQRNAEKHDDTSIYDAVSAFPGSERDELETVNLTVSETEKQQIIALAQAGVPRRDILRRMRWGAAKYQIIRQVLDQEEGL